MKQSVFLVIFISMSFLSCDKRDEPVDKEIAEAEDAEIEIKDTRSDLEIVMDNIDGILTTEEARVLYLRGCNADTDRVATECSCLVNYFEEHLTAPLFDLESAWEAGETDLIASMNSALRSVGFNYLKYSAQTKMDAWDACLEGVRVE